MAEPHDLAGDSGVPEVSDTDLPHKSVQCGSGQELDGECITDEKAQEVIEQASDAAVEQMIQVQGDPEAQVEAQQTLTKIQEQRIDNAVKDTEQIKKLIRDKKKAGGLKNLPKDPFGEFDKGGGGFAKMPKNQMPPSQTDPI